MFSKKEPGAEAPMDAPNGVLEDEDEMLGVAGDEVADPDVADAFDEEDEYEEEEYEEPHPRDPLVGWMTLVSVLLMLVVVGATVALVFFLLGMRGAPRTAAEREITAAEASVKADPSAENYKGLAYSYLTAARYSDALSAVGRGRKVKDGSMFDLLEADILRMQGENEGAVELYKKAAVRNTKEYEAEKKAMVKKGISSPPSRTMYVSIMIGEGESLMSLGSKKEALKAFKEAVRWEPTNSYALVRVGDLSRELGLTKEAKAAYEEALRFIPDYEPAKAGLAKLSDGTKGKATDGED